MKYRWTMVVEVTADDDIEAQSCVEEYLEEADRDPDGLFSHGKLEKVSKDPGFGLSDHAKAELVLRLNELRRSLNVGIGENIDGILEAFVGSKVPPQGAGGG